MPEVDPVILQLRAENGKYLADLRSTTRSADQQLGQQQRSVKRLEQQFQSSSSAISGQVRRLATVFAAAFSARQVQQLADGYTRFTNQLQVAGLEGQNLAKTQEELFEIAQRYGVELESLGTLFSRGAQVSAELGASQAELVQFTEGVAAALKIQGSSASQAQGALLQLSQALGSGTIRAEEFNSINEGALPILQAVARNIDAAGGSVARLKTMVNDGKLSSDQFFRAFLAGSKGLQEQAAAASLTIGNSFTILNNALGKFVGETDDALSATERISQAIILLADNLDVVLKALAAIAVVMLGRFTAGMVAGAASTLSASTAVFALQARAAGAATTMEALAFASRAAGKSMLAAFGGPVGLAITALGTGLYYLVTSTNDAVRSIDELNKRAQTAAEKADDMERRLREAGVAVEGLGNKSRTAASGVDELTGSLEAAIRRAKELEDATGVTRVRELEGQVREASTRTAVAQRAFDKLHPNMREGMIGQRLQDTLNAAKAEEDALRRQLRAQTTAMRHGVNLEDTQTASAVPGKPDKPKKPPKQTGPTAAETARRHEGELARLRQEELQAQIDLATDARDRADLQMEALSEEYALRSAQLAADEHFTADQKKAQQAILDKLYGLARASDGTITVGSPGLLQQRIRSDLDEELAQLQREELGRRHDQLALEADALYARADIADTLEQRRFLEDNALAIQQQIERELLEQAIAEGRVTDAAQARALLHERQRAEAVGLTRRNQGALGRYLDDTADTAARAEEAATRELQALRDGIADGLSEQLGVKNQFIKDMLSIFLDDVLFRPIAEALRNTGGGGIGGFISSAIGSLFGRASGGYVGPGQMVRVNEHRPGVELLRMGPQGGTVIPLGATNAVASRPQPVQVVVKVQANDYFDAKVAGISQRVATPIAQGVATQVGAAVGQAVLKGMPARMAQFQRDGT